MGETELVPLVLVTGANGYIATHIIKLLQDEGYKVRGTVRSLDNKKKVGELQNLSARYPIELVEADLTNTAGWNEAVKDCTYVIHTASLFPDFEKIKNPEEEVIKPAVECTKTVMRACIEAATVRRLVLTSSCVAIFGQSHPDKELYTEDDWADTDSSECNLYCKSKTLAEKEAWKMVKENPGKIELAVINPTMVIGPVLTSSVKGNASVQFLRSIFEYDYPFNPALGSSLCDVREVAQAHFKAMIVPEAAGHRHLIATGNLWMEEVGKILYHKFYYYGYNPTTSTKPNDLPWFGPNKHLSDPILPLWGTVPVYSTKRMREVLGIEPRLIHETVIEMAESLLDKGIIEQTEIYKKNRKPEENYKGFYKVI